MLCVSCGQEGRGQGAGAEASNQAQVHRAEERSPDYRLLRQPQATCPSAPIGTDLSATATHQGGCPQDSETPHGLLLWLPSQPLGAHSTRPGPAQRTDF